MSLIRDSRYSAYAARICRTDGHRIEGDRCEVCHIRRDVYDTSPYVPRTGLGGVPVGSMVASATTPRAAPREKCDEGHTDWARNHDGTRRCRPCVNEWQRTSRLSFGRRFTA